MPASSRRNSRSFFLACHRAVKYGRRSRAPPELESSVTRRINFVVLIQQTRYMDRACLLAMSSARSSGVLVRRRHCPPSPHGRWDAPVLAATHQLAVPARAAACRKRKAGVDSGQLGSAPRSVADVRSRWPNLTAADSARFPIGAHFAQTGGVPVKKCRDPIQVPSAAAVVKSKVAPRDATAGRYRNRSSPAQAVSGSILQRRGLASLCRRLPQCRHHDQVIAHHLVCEPITARCSGVLPSASRRFRSMLSLKDVANALDIHRARAAVWIG